MSLSGVEATEISWFGTLFFVSAAIGFSDADGMLVAPPVGAPGSAAGSDIDAVV